MTKPLERDAIYLKRHFDAEIIVLSVCWYITYKVSYRDLAAMMAERGVGVPHTAIMRWVIRYAVRFLVVKAGMPVPVYIDKSERLFPMRCFGRTGRRQVPSATCRAMLRTAPPLLCLHLGGARAVQPCGQQCDGKGLHQRRRLTNTGAQVP